MPETPAHDPGIGAQDRPESPLTMVRNTHLPVPSLRDGRFGLWELWKTRSVFQAVVGERSVSLVHNGGSFHSPVSRARVHLFRRPERATHQDAPGSTQSDPDDPEVVSVYRTYGSFRKLGVAPRTLAAAS